MPKFGIMGIKTPALVSSGYNIFNTQKKKYVRLCLLNIFKTLKKKSFSPNIIFEINISVQIKQIINRYSI